MFQIDDKVVYNSTGVYEIVGIREETDINHTETEYYILQPVYNNNLTIKLPVDNKSLPIRKIITKEQALSIIAAMPDQDTIWIENDKERYGRFKAAIKADDNIKLVQIIKAIYMMKQEKISAGKKLLKSDEDIMRSAEKNLYEELGAALNIPLDHVLPFIMEHVS
jgi:CarD family transcriptional regulator